jgi:hypothetical protein
VGGNIPGFLCEDRDLRAVMFEAEAPLALHLPAGDVVNHNESSIDIP